MNKYHICYNQLILKIFIMIYLEHIYANLNKLLLFLINDSYFNLDITTFGEIWYDTKSCIYYILGYTIFYSTMKRNQNDGIIIFGKQN